MADLGLLTKWRRLLCFILGPKRAARVGVDLNALAHARTLANFARRERWQRENGARAAIWIRYWLQRKCALGQITEVASRAVEDLANDIERAP